MFNGVLAHRMIRFSFRNLNPSSANLSIVPYLLPVHLALSCHTKGFEIHFPEPTGFKKR